MSIYSYRLLLADPPWLFDDKLPGRSRGAAKNYECSAHEKLMKFKLPPLADAAILLLWRVSSMQQEALDVAKAWGFVVKSEIVWRKRTPTGKEHFGMGRYVRAAHETCLIAARGRATALVKNHATRSVFEADDVFDAATGKHSQKPDEFYALAEALFDGPRFELFARKRRDGWTQEGAELGSIL